MLFKVRDDLLFYVVLAHFSSSRTADSIAALISLIGVGRGESSESESHRFSAFSQGGLIDRSGRRPAWLSLASLGTISLVKKLSISSLPLLLSTSFSIG